MNTNDMTIETANKIWNDCYNSSDLSLWNNYTSAQRLQAIETRDAHANGGQWGIWNISDRD
jgi:hypothetical protein